jgi:hypothetical protein
MTQTRSLARTPGQKAPTPGPPRRTSGGPVRLTGRGGVVALFAVCFGGLLLAAATGWAVLADVVFVMACGLVACYTRPGGLRSVVVCPPLAFCTGSILAQLIVASDTFSALTGILVTLGSSALWLFTGTVLTMAIALGRGWRPATVLSVLANLRAGLRESRNKRPGRAGPPWTRPRGQRRLRGGRATAQRHLARTLPCRGSRRSVPLVQHVNRRVTTAAAHGADSRPLPW